MNSREDLLRLCFKKSAQEKMLLLLLHLSDLSRAPLDFGDGVCVHIFELGNAFPNSFLGCSHSWVVVSPSIVRCAALFFFYFNLSHGIVYDFVNPTSLHFQLDFFLYFNRRNSVIKRGKIHY